MADERDPEVPQRVSQRYRELGAEEPPRALDRSILDAARRATEKPHAPLVTPAGRHRWYFSLAAAAIVVLAVAVTWHVERTQPDADGYALKEPVPEKPAAAADARSEVAQAQEQRQFEQERRQAAPAKPAPAKPAPAPTPELRQAPPELARDAVGAASAPAESRVRENAPGEVARADVQTAPAPAAPPPPAAEPVQKGAVAGARAQRAERSAPLASAYMDNPERFLERIAELRKEGRHNEADQALAEFRTRYPDYRISEEMLQKVERKK